MPEHQCHVCGKLFTQLGKLNCHIRIHTGEKPYNCLTCGKRFRLKAHLNRHQISHTGVRTYICPTCGRAFGRSDHLLRHMRQLHPVLPATTESHEEATGTVTATTHTFSTAQVYTEVIYISSRLGYARLVTQKGPLTTTTSITQGGKTSSYIQGRTLEEQEAVEALLKLRRAEDTDD